MLRGNSHVVIIFMDRAIAAVKAGRKVSNHLAVFSTDTSQQLCKG